MTTPSRPSETERGITWLSQFLDEEQDTARLLLDSIEIVSSSKLFEGIQSTIERFRRWKTSQDRIVVIPLRDINDLSKKENERRVNEAQKLPSMWDTWHPWQDLPSSAGSELLIVNLLAKSQLLMKPLSSAKMAANQSEVDRKLINSGKCQAILIVTDYIGTGKQVKTFIDSITASTPYRNCPEESRPDIYVCCYAVSGRTLNSPPFMANGIFYYKVAQDVNSYPWTPEHRRRILEFCKTHGPEGNLGLGFGNEEFPPIGALFLTQTTIPNTVPDVLRGCSKGAGTPFVDRREYNSGLFRELMHYVPISPDLDTLIGVKPEGLALFGPNVDPGLVRTLVSLSKNTKRSNSELETELGIEPEHLCRSISFSVRLRLCEAFPPNDSSANKYEVELTDAGRDAILSISGVHTRRPERLTAAPSPYYPKRVGRSGTDLA